jgi:hypothetical protein
LKLVTVPFPFSVLTETPINELEKLLMNYLKKVHAPKWAEGITWKKLPLSEINSSY